MILEIILYRCVETRYPPANIVACILEILEIILYRCVVTRYPPVNIVVYTRDTGDYII